MIIDYETWSNFITKYDKVRKVFIFCFITLYFIGLHTNPVGISAYVILVVSLGWLVIGGENNE